MAKSEKIYWHVLNRMHNNSITMRQQLLDNPPTETPLDHAIGIRDLESELVLAFGKTEIEETLYFLEKRGYLSVHGYGIAMPRMAYSLSEKAFEVLEERKMPDDEIRAFDTPVLDVSKPGIWGMKFDVKSAWKRGSRRIKKIFDRD